MQKIFGLLAFSLIVAEAGTGAFAGPVDASAKLTLIRPRAFDSKVCDVQVFSGSLSSLVRAPAPVTGATATFDTRVINPSGNRAALEIDVLQSGLSTAQLRLEGERAALEGIEAELRDGREVTLSEFKVCASSSARYVELASFRPQRPELAKLDLTARIEIIRKNPQGACAVMVSTTLGDLIRRYHSGVALDGIAADVAVFAGAVSSAGALVSKRVQIGFRQQLGSSSHALASPRLSITLPSELAYTALDRLSVPGGVLQMTGVPACKGTRPDDPVWIQGFELQ